MYFSAPDLKYKNMVTGSSNGNVKQAHIERKAVMARNGDESGTELDKFEQRPQL
jgi:hypothetical protein